MYIIKKEDGSQVGIKVNPSMRYSESIEYRISVYRKEKGKRKWIEVVDTDSYEYRKQSFPEGRMEYTMNKYKEYVSEQDIISACEELWIKLKPSFENIEASL